MTVTRTQAPPQSPVTTRPEPTQRTDGATPAGPQRPEAAGAWQARQPTRAVAPSPSVQLFTGEQDDLRVYSLNPADAAAVQQDVHAQLARAAEAKPPAPERTTTAADVTQALKAAATARAAQLEDLAHAPAAPPVLPEDATLKPSVAHLTVGKDLDAAFARTLARVGLLEGFPVVVAGDAATLKASLGPKELSNVTFAPRAGGASPWVEDSGELHAGGTVSIPARLALDEEAFFHAIQTERVLRMRPDMPADERAALETTRSWALEERYPESAFTLPGKVAATKAHEGKAAMATAQGRPLRRSLTYLEGGNVLAGTRPDGSPYALVGADSVVTSRLVLEQDLGRLPSDDEVKLAIAKDLGLTPQQLVVIEQPGTFHLDMALRPLGPGQLVLNDAKAAYATQAARLRAEHRAKKPTGDAAVQDWEKQGRLLERNLAELAKVADRDAAMEAKAERELRQAGFTVSRAAGRYLNPADGGQTDAYNFLNGEVAQGKDGRPFMVTQGGPTELEQAFVLALAVLPGAPARVYFGDRKASAQSLANFGGTGCRVKFDGVRVKP